MNESKGNVIINLEVKSKLRLKGRLVMYSLLIKVKYYG